MAEPRGYQFIGRKLSKASRLLNKRIIEDFSDYDIGIGQLFALLALYDEEGRCQNEICEIYNLNKAAVGRSLKKLEKKGFIERKPAPEDKRIKRVYLQEKGRSFRSKCMQCLENIEKEISSDISPKELEIFNKVIEKTCEALKCDSKGEKSEESRVEITKIEPETS